METITETVEVLNDLMAIQNDRIRSYENALNDTTDENLKRIFGSIIVESRFMRLELAEEVRSHGAEFETGTTGAGKLFRAWTDVKAVFTGHDSHSILENCEHVEDATLEAYYDALSSEHLEPHVRTILTKQQHVAK